MMGLPVSSAGHLERDTGAIASAERSHLSDIADSSLMAVPRDPAFPWGRLAFTLELVVGKQSFASKWQPYGG